MRFAGLPCFSRPLWLAYDVSVLHIKTVTVSLTILRRSCVYAYDYLCCAAACRRCREKEVIILSMVRSNTTGTIGFLQEARRTNVAVTRARRQCVVIGDSDTLGRDEFLAGLLSHCSDHGLHRSAAEYTDGHSFASLQLPSCGGAHDDDDGCTPADDQRHKKQKQNQRLKQRQKKQIGGESKPEQSPAASEAEVRACEARLLPLLGPILGDIDKDAQQKGALRVRFHIIRNARI